MRRSWSFVAVAALVVLTSGLAACGGSGSANPQGKLQIVATTTQVADFARNVGGDQVQVHQILKSNVDAHDYEISPRDIDAIAHASLVVKNGVHLEPWLDDAAEAAGFSGPVVDTSAGITLRHNEKSGEADPHIWQDPNNAKVMAANIATALMKKDPTHKEIFELNLRSYSAKLDALDHKIQAQINSIPIAQRKLVTNHDAFGYYLDRYHVQFIGSVIPSFDTSAELSGKDIDRLVTKINDTGVRAIFSENSMPPKTADVIGKVAHVKVEAGEESLYGDSLGPAESAGATYIAMEEHNTQVIVDGLR